MENTERGKIRVYADIRERGTRTAALLERKAVVIYRRLDVGDYLVSSEAVVERKTISDYLKSLYDGRLFDQARRIAETYQFPIMVIEGSKLPYMDRLKFYSSMTSLVVDYGFRVFIALRPEDSADIIYGIAKKFASGRKGQYMVVHKKPKLSTPREWQLYIVQSLPYIGVKLAERLLQYFGSIEKIVNAPVSELSKVPGIGEKRAEEIYRLLHSSYRVEKGRRPHLDEFFP